MRWLGYLLGAPLLVAYGCAGSKPAPDTPATTPPAEQEAPRKQLEETPPPYGEEKADPQSPPAAGPQGAPGGSEASSVAQAEVEAFADIQLSLVPMQQRLSEQAQAGASQEELRQLQGQFQQQAAQIVEASALSLDRFNEIATLVQRDADLQRRVQVAIEQKAGGR